MFKAEPYGSPVQGLMYPLTFELHDQPRFNAASIRPKGTSCISNTRYHVIRHLEP